MPYMDIIVSSPDERPQLAVEVKNTPKTSASWAAQLRHNLYSMSAIPSAPYFMVAALDHLFLWRQASATGISEERQPDFEVDAEQFLRPYYELGEFRNRPPSGYAMEIVVAAWLKDIVRTEPPRNDQKYRWLFDSGLYDAIRDGTVRTEVPV